MQAGDKRDGENVRMDSETDDSFVSSRGFYVTKGKREIKINFGYIRLSEAVTNTMRHEMFQ